MRTTLLASTCLMSVLAVPAHAETTITTATTAPVFTGSLQSGQPDDLIISSTGSITPSTGTAVTVNSNNNVVNNGSIRVTDANGARGIVVNSNITGNITNGATGRIVIDELYTPTDTNGDGNLDGPFAMGSDRVGIDISGPFTGNISNSGLIQIKGNNSAGIRVGGLLTGNFVNNGTITVLGDNALGVSLSDVDGNVRLAGTITASGLNATAAKLGGDISGTLEVQGNLSSSGYRYTTVPPNPSLLGPDDLLQGGPALSIEGNVLGGIILAVPPANTDPNNPDEDGDGIPDATEGSASVRSFGSAPAMRVGHASDDIVIGTLPGNDMGIVINGAVSGSGLYAGVTATGLQIGGTGGNVDVGGGLGITGSVAAGSRDVAATAIRIGSGATVPEIRNSGRIDAASSGTAAAAIATGILIEAGGSVTTIRNSGSITAITGGNDGTAQAIRDVSGDVILVQNSGLIFAAGALSTSDRNIAIDLSANTTGATVNQVAGAAGAAAPRIVGDIRFGSGNNLLSVSSGSVQGDVFFGTGDDRLALSGTSRFFGNADFGGGGADTLSITDTAVFSGMLSNAAGLAATVNGGILDINGPASIASLAVTGGGSIGVTLGGTTGTSLQVSGNASFAANSKLILQITSIAQGQGQHVILNAGSITGAANLTANNSLLPFLYNGIIGFDNTQITVDVTRKTVDQLGLNASESSAFDAVIKAATQDALVEGTILSIYDSANFRNTLGQMLPDHAGGAFETVASGSRALARWLIDPTTPYRDEGKWGWFVSQAVWGGSKSISNTASYNVTGWGISIGGEIKTDVGNFGGAVGFLGGTDRNRANSNEVITSQWEGALHWRLASNGFNAHARVSGAPIKFDGTRIFTITDQVGTMNRTIGGKWDGTLYSASGGLSLDRRTGNFTIRPAVTVDYYKLSEDGYQERGGGKALDLTVSDRDSDELAVSGTLALGLQFGGREPTANFSRFELEGGRRQIVSGNLGATTASFTGGDAFTLTPEDRTSGWVGRLRAISGNSGFQFGGEISAEEQQCRTAWAVRASLRISL